MSAAILIPGVRIQGATYAGICTAADGSLYALLLLDDKPAARLSWQASMAWAKEAGGDLPTRPESALLFALLKDRFTAAYHWTNETCAWDASYAWICDFLTGLQYFNPKSFEGCARAVRRLPLHSFNSLVELAASVEGGAA